MRADIAESYFMTLGILPRMRLLACGWTNPGDKLRLPTDAAWWSRPYAFPLWAPLWTYAQQVKASGNESGWHIDEQLASGDPGALSHSLLAVADELATLTRIGHDKCAPYIIPRVRGVLPAPNAVCIAKLKIPPKQKERERARDERNAIDYGALVKVLLVAGAIYLVSFHWRHGRAPWSHA